MLLCWRTTRMTCCLTSTAAPPTCPPRSWGPTPSTRGGQQTCGAWGWCSTPCWSEGALEKMMMKHFKNFSCCRYPFHGAEHSGLFAKIRRGQFNLPDNLSSRAKCLIKCLLRKDPSERITTEDVLVHPWLLGSHRERGVHRRSPGLDNPEHAVPVWSPSLEEPSPFSGGQIQAFRDQPQSATSDNNNSAR